MQIPYDCIIPRSERQSCKSSFGKYAATNDKVSGFFADSGAEWVDRPVVVAGNVITARQPKDAVPFARAVLDALRAGR